MRFLVVDDHAILRKGLVKILKGEFNEAQFFEASNGAEALTMLKNEALDIALLDISMPGLNGVEVLKQAQALNIKTPILILSMQPEEQYALRVLKAGAHGFLNKESALEDLIAAVNKVLSGKKYISETIADILIETTNKKEVVNQHELLSDREMEVLHLLGQGKTITQIANQIHLSVNTISTYRSRIMDKLHLSSNAAIIKYAIENDLV